jgi:hypothetical protein
MWKKIYLLMKWICKTAAEYPIHDSHTDVLEDASLLGQKLPHCILALPYPQQEGTVSALVIAWQVYPINRESWMVVTAPPSATSRCLIMSHPSYRDWLQLVVWLSLYNCWSAGHPTPPHVSSCLLRLRLGFSLSFSYTARYWTRTLSLM